MANQKWFEPFRVIHCAAPSPKCFCGTYLWFMYIDVYLNCLHWVWKYMYVYVHAEYEIETKTCGLLARNLCRITLTSCLHLRPSQSFELGTTWSSVAGSERAYAPIDWPGSLDFLFSCKFDRIHKHLHTHRYIYIYRERERERERDFSPLQCLRDLSSTKTCMLCHAHSARLCCAHEALDWAKKFTTAPNLSNEPRIYAAESCLHAAFRIFFPQTCSCGGSSGMKTRLWPGRSVSSFTKIQSWTWWDHYRNVVNLQVFDLLVRPTLKSGKQQPNLAPANQISTTTTTTTKWQKHQPQ